MCGLCGAFGGEDHWTTGRTDSATAASNAVDPALRRRERAYRLRLVNRVLASCRLQLSDFQGSAYVLAGPTGKQEIVHDLGAVWAAAEAMSGRALDPLDPQLLAPDRSA